METNSGLKSELKFKNDIQIIDNEGDLERQSYGKNLESLKFSKNVKEFKAQLEQVIISILFLVRTTTQ